MNNAASSNCKDEKNRSDKSCVCGGHNANNPKRNLNNSGTRRKLAVRQGRIAAELEKDLLLDQIELPFEFSKVVDDNLFDLV